MKRTNIYNFFRNLRESGGKKTQDKTLISGKCNACQRQRDDISYIYGIHVCKSCVTCLLRAIKKIQCEGKSFSLCKYEAKGQPCTINYCLHHKLTNARFYGLKLEGTYVLQLLRYLS